MAMPTVTTLPTSAVVFNSPFVKPAKINLKLTNTGSQLIGWTFKSTNIRRFEVKPIEGMLEPQQTVMLDLTCHPFDYEKEIAAGAPDHRLTIETADAPVGCKGFSRDWFTSTPLVCRKIIPVVLNI